LCLLCPGGKQSRVQSAPPIRWQCRAAPKAGKLTSVVEVDPSGARWHPFHLGDVDAKAAGGHSQLCGQTLSQSGIILLPYVFFYPDNRVQFLGVEDSTHGAWERL
jgi:hypothetical protein